MGYWVVAWFVALLQNSYANGISVVTVEGNRDHSYSASCPDGYVIIGIDALAANRLGGPTGSGAYFDSNINPTIAYLPQIFPYTGLSSFKIYCAKGCSSNVYVNSNPYGLKLISSNKPNVGGSIDFYGNTINNSFLTAAQTTNAMNGCPFNHFPVGNKTDNASNIYWWCLPK